MFTVTFVPHEMPGIARPDALTYRREEHGPNVADATRMPTAFVDEVVVVG